MILMVCIDNRKGMMFNHRRQSRDRILCDRMCELAHDNVLWMNAYSGKMFTDADLTKTHTNLRIEEDFLTQAGSGDYCLAETEDPSFCKERIEELILFHWNRDYPADVHFTMDLSGWTLTDIQEYAGFSHEKITEEHFVRSHPVS